MYIWNIYKVTCSITGKSYIGQTRAKLQTRLHKHVSDSRKKCPCYFGKAIKKHGWGKFTVVIVEDGIASQKEADQKECDYILSYGTLTPNGYNIKSGGQSSGFNGSSITKFIPKNYEKKTIKVTAIKDNVAVSFRTIRDASKFYNIEPQHIQAAIKKNSRYAKGVYFYRTEEFSASIVKANSKSGKFVKIHCIKSNKSFYFVKLEDAKSLLGSVKNFSTHVKKGWKINGYSCTYITENEYIMSQPNKGQTI